MENLISPSRNAGTSASEEEAQPIPPQGQTAAAATCSRWSKEQDCTNPQNTPHFTPAETSFAFSFTQHSMNYKNVNSVGCQYLGPE